MAPAVPTRLPRTLLLERWGTAPSVLFAVATVVALAAALAAPLAVAVVGLAVFGLAHVALETRYVVGRFSPRIGFGLIAVCLGAITAIAAVRLAGPPWASRFEAAAVFALVAGGWVWATRSRPWIAVLGTALIACGATASVVWVAWFVVMIVHVHNLTPVAFLWDWSATGFARRAHRSMFRAAVLTWALVVPALILSGMFDAVLSGGGLWQPGQAGSLDSVAAAYTPPALRSGDWPLRFLAVFAFLQTMHYVCWIGFLPAASRGESAVAAETPLFRRISAPRRFVILVAGCAVAMAVVFALDYASGKWLYGAVAAYHAYVEFPVLIAAGLLALGLTSRAGTV